MWKVPTPPPLKLVAARAAALPRLTGLGTAAQALKLPRGESFTAQFSGAPLLRVLTFDVIAHQAAAADNITTRDRTWLRAGAPINSAKLGHGTLSGLVEIGASATPRASGKTLWPELAIRDPSTRGGWKQNVPVAVKLVPDGPEFNTDAKLRQAMHMLKMLAGANVPVNLTGTRSSSEFVFTSITAKVNGSTNPRLPHERRPT